MVLVLFGFRVMVHVNIYERPTTVLGSDPESALVRGAFWWPPTHPPGRGMGGALLVGQAPVASTLASLWRLLWPAGRHSCGQLTCTMLTPEAVCGLEGVWIRVRRLCVRYCAPKWASR